MDLKVIVVSCAAMFLFVGFSVQPVRAASNCEKQTIFTISTGKENGGYYNFAQRMSKFLAKECIILNVKESNGSVENLSRLKNKEVELAIVQSDVSYQTYKNSFEGFSTIFPIFNEYVQLVSRKDSSIWYGDLKGRPVLLGKINSGTAVNARDVIGQADLTDDFRYGDICQSLTDREVDAGFVTSKNMASCEHLKTKLISIPNDILRDIVSAKPYYSISKDESVYGSSAALSIQAYLVIRNDFDIGKTQQLELMIKTLGKNWTSLDKNMIPLSKALNADVWPAINSLSKKIILDNNFAIDPLRKYWYFAGWIALSILIYIFNRNKNIYNRLGHYGHRRKISFWSQNWFIKTTSYVHALLVFLIIFSALTIIIQLSEQHYDPNSLFTNMSIWQLMLWVLTFMASGFTSDLYPSGNVAQIIITGLALVGVFAPLFFIYKAVDKAQEKNKNERRGLVPIRLKGHVVICGWNEKVPGIIYSLTCNDVPQKRQVIVVAEMDDEYPLDIYNFDRKYVAYYRGDSANNAVLIKASAHNASTALIVAGNKKRKGKNITSVLAALALKKVNSDIFIASELIYSKNRQYFESADVDLIFDFNVICNHLIVLATINPSIIDFILDILTYDEHSEIYSIPMDDFNESVPGIGAIFSPAEIRNKERIYDLLSSDLTAGDGIKELLVNGINIVGCSRPNNREKGVVSGDFKKDEHNFPIIDTTKLSGIASGDILFYLAEEKSDIFSLSENYVSKCKAVDGLELPFCSGYRVLVLGESLDRFEKIKSLYECLPFDIKVDYFSEVMIEDDINLAGILERIRQGDVTHVVNLSSIEEGRNVVIDDRGLLDAEAVLIAKAIANYSVDIVIISELVNLNSKSILETSGVDVVISQALFVERFFTKVIYNHGLVTDFLVGLLNVADGQFLYVMDVEQEDCFVDKYYSDVWFEHYKDFRLIACLPTCLVDELANKEDDFKTHFVVSPRKLMQNKIEAGDKLVFIINIDN